MAVVLLVACTTPTSDETVAATAIVTAPPGGFPTVDPRSLLFHDCPVTLPNGRQPPGVERDPTWHGQGEIWMTIPLNGIVDPPYEHPWAVYVPDDDAPVTVEGERLDRDGEPLAVNLVPRSTPAHLHRGTLRFPTEGCWRVTARQADNSLVVSVLVRPPR